MADAFRVELRDVVTTGVWTDVSTKVYQREGATITRGRPDEASTVNPSACRLQLNNRDGSFSPRNPIGTYYGKIGRNTPLRVSTTAAASWLDFPVQSGTTTLCGVKTPDAAALDLTGDIEIDIEADLDSWRDAIPLVSKWTETGNQRSYSFEVTATGTLRLLWTSAGTFATQLSIESTLPVPVTEGRLTVAVALDVNVGGTSRTGMFYTGTAGLGGAMTQLGTTVTQTGITSIFAGTSQAYIGLNPNGTTTATTTGPGGNVRGRILKARWFNPSVGTLVANPDFTAQADGTTSFADSAGRTWTVDGAAAITNRDVRFCGQVSAWPVRWDTSGTDVWTEIEANGKLRQLGQGAAQITTTLSNLALLRDSSTTAYWPATDADGATSIASGQAGGRPMAVIGVPTLGDYLGPLRSTDAIPTLNSASFTGTVPAHTATNTIIMTFLLSIPAAGDTNNAVVARLASSGAVTTTDVIYTTASSGSLTMNSYSETGAVLNTGTALTGMNGKDFFVQMLLSDSLGSVSTKFHVMNIATSGIQQDNSGSFSTTSGRATKVTINPGANLVTMRVGQIQTRSAGLELFSDTTAQGAAIAYNGETAGRRFERLCTEQGIEFKGVGDLDYTERMGAQLPGSLVDLLGQCVEADLGIMFEPREFIGLAYRTRTSLYNQTARLALDYAQAQMDALDPVEDDQLLRNDITVTRTAGTSARVRQTTGPLSVSPPPVGVGIYDDSIEVNYYEDAQCADAASWRVHLGTVDESRFPTIPLTLHGLHLTSLVTDISGLDLGDRLTVSNPPSWLPPDQIQQLAQGFTEYLNTFERRVDLNCSPASVADIGRYASATSSGANQYKYSSDGTTTRSTMTTTSTTLDLTTATGPLWTIEAAQYPIDLVVAGERMTATSGSGTTASTQSMVVTRSVNGVIKTHAVGETVALYRPARYAL